jgi:proteic killer suppression protein
VIHSFRDRETERIWAGTLSRKLPQHIQNRALMKLQQLNAAGHLDDLRIPPSNRLERLAGDRTGQWSIRINGQWRICFEWHDANAHNVEICDYH